MKVKSAGEAEWIAKKIFVPVADKKNATDFSYVFGFFLVVESLFHRTTTITKIGTWIGIWTTARDRKWVSFRLESPADVQQPGRRKRSYRRNEFPSESNSISGKLAPQERYYNQDKAHANFAVWTPRNLEMVVTAGAYNAHQLVIFCSSSRC